MTRVSTELKTARAHRSPGEELHADAHHTRTHSLHVSESVNAHDPPATAMHYVRHSFPCGPNCSHWCPVANDIYRNPWLPLSRFLLCTASLVAAALHSHDALSASPRLSRSHCHRGRLQPSTRPRAARCRPGRRSRRLSARGARCISFVHVPRLELPPDRARPPPRRSRLQNV